MSRNKMDDGVPSRFYVKATSGSGGGGGGGGGGGEGGGGLGGKGSGSSKCGRWNPTAEQVKVLTELFRSGLRTPSSDQIQKISHQLSFYGKIESKNVFYWFQNHKARERQKRRKLSLSVDVDVDVDDTTPKQYFIHHHHHYNHNNIPPPNYFAETTNKGTVNQLEPERMRRTLQLFPLNSNNPIDETEAEDDEFRVNGKQYEEATAFTYKIETKMDHPPLDLRLSFL